MPIKPDHPDCRHRGSSRGAGWIPALAAAVWVAVLPGVAAAERRAGLALAAEGRCAAALAELRDAGPGQEPAEDDPRVLLVIGTCESRLGHHAQALQALDRARALDHELPGLDLRLAIARFHEGDMDGAERALDRADTAGASAESLLYRGLIRVERGADADGMGDAARVLEAAARLDAHAVEPVASFYAGIAWRAAGSPSAARRAFERVAEDWRGTPWGLRAEQALRDGEKDAPRRFARAEAGLEYDDNVVLRGAGVSLPREISDERDVRGAFEADLGGEVWRSRAFTLGLRLRYAGRVHRDLARFDSHFPAISGWLDRPIGPRSVLRLEGLYGYAWVDGAPFSSTGRARLSWLHDGGTRGITRVAAELRTERYHFANRDVPDGPGRAGAPCGPAGTLLCAPPGIDERRERNRSGLGIRLSLQQRWQPQGPTGPELWISTALERFRARGSEYDFDSAELEAGAVWPLPLDFSLRLEGAYRYRPYRSSTTFPATRGLVAGRQYALPSRRKRERGYEIRVALEKQLLQGLAISARWRYTRSDASEDVFDYRRSVVGAYLSLSLGGQ